MTPADRKLNSRIELIISKPGIAMLTISNNPQLLPTGGAPKVFARVQLTEATPKQAGGCAGEWELESWWRIARQVFRSLSSRKINSRRSARCHPMICRPFILHSEFARHGETRGTS